jgi:acetyl/propionyl-CoA carboxylase alpha subunit
MEKSFKITVDGVDYTIAVNGNTFLVNGHPFVVGFEDDGSLTIDGIAFDVALDGDTAIVDGIGHQILVFGADPVPASRRAATPRPSTLGAGTVQAIMPGSIVRVLVTEGDPVEVGDVLLVLEAMKMENELHAPISGVVKAVYASTGQAVEMNEVLAEIEASRP